MDGVKVELTEARTNRIRVYKAILALMPPKYGYGPIITERLNSRGRKTGRRKPYNTLSVYSIIAQGTWDRHVEDCLIELAVEYNDKPITQLLPWYTPTYETALVPA